jgi:DNA-binding NarL/FixJ family response regulator
LAGWFSIKCAEAPCKIGETKDIFRLFLFFFDVETYHVVLRLKKIVITDKKFEILQLMAEGYNSEEIARKLGNSKMTIDAIWIEMLNRFQVKNAAHLVAYAFRKKWLK